MIAISKQLKPVSPKQPIVLGTIGSAYGIRGWLKVFSSTENAESIFDYQPWLIQQLAQWQFIELEDWKHHSQDLIIKVKGIDDRDAASSLTHCEIIVDSEQLPSLEGDNYYWKDLMGCQVVTPSGYELGKVIDMIETGSNDVMVVKANLKDTFGIKKRLVPFLHGKVIKKIDLTARVIKADWNPGF
jgi:16S rRNA processing protein RimM